MIDRNTPEYAAIVAILDEREMAVERPDSQETADLIVSALASVTPSEPTLDAAPELRAALDAFDALMRERDDDTSARRYADHALAFLNSHRTALRAALSAPSRSRD